MHRLLITLIFPSTIFLIGCSDNCEKVFEKTVECAKDSVIKTSLRNNKSTILKLCKPFDEKVKKCLKLSDCSRFNFCMKEVTPSLREQNIKKPITDDKNTDGKTKTDKKGGNIPGKPDGTDSKAFDKNKF